ncbi:hypothetical protein RSW80_27180, partial [Escherichia coli]|uniref:hypothetical protein n=1 Tax=Escherichia coli TaxID=562 RepID=UPI0028DFC712
QFVDAHDPAATGKLFFLGAEFVLLSIPLGVLTVLAAGWLAAAFRRTKWVEREHHVGHRQGWRSHPLAEP